MKRCSDCHKEITKQNQKITNKKYVNKLCKTCYSKKYSTKSLKTWNPKEKSRTKFLNRYDAEIYC